MSLPVDLSLILDEAVREGKREPDGLLHPSTDLVDTRHAQLRWAGFAEKEPSTAQMVRLETGTMWHERLHDRLRRIGLPFMAEVKLDPWLPEDWAGTADWLIFDPTKQAYCLTDVKTTTGQGVSYRAAEGMSESHWLQASAYFHAASRMGIPLVDRVYVFYLPMDDRDGAEPIVCEDKPCPVEVMDATMNTIRDVCMAFAPKDEDDVYMSELEPTKEREQKVFWNSTRKVFDLKLVPHWLTRYCPFGEVCGCGDTPTTKIGEYVWDTEEAELVYLSREGYADYTPSAVPSRGDIQRRFRASS